MSLETGLRIKKILIRADSSSTIGTGHIYRNLVLASRYKNAHISFAMQELEGNIKQKILDAGHKVILLQSNTIKELNKTIKSHKPDLLIIDNYQIHYKDEKKIKKKNPHLKMLVLDDTYQEHYCDILLNHNIYADKKKYKNLVPKNCEIRCGKKHTLLRDEFLKEKQRDKTAKKKNILIAMGGADSANLTKPILKSLKKLPKIPINIVTTSANKNLTTLRKYIKNKVWITLHINATNMASLMNKSSFAIITPSVSANEIHYLDKRFLAIKTASNQKYMYKYLKNNGFLVLKKFTKKSFIKKVSDEI